MEEEKGIEVEYAYTMGNNINYMQGLLESFTRTNNFEDAKEYTNDIINSMLDTWVSDYYHGNKALAKKLFNKNYINAKITFLGDDDICIQMTLFYRDPDTNKLYSETRGNVMTLEDITYSGLAGKDNNERELAYSCTTAIFSDYIIDCFEELVNYVSEREEQK